MTKDRNLSLDLLRVVAMLMVVAVHFIGKGNVLSAYTASSLEYNTTLFIQSIALVAVNCYVLISGYFLVLSRFKIKKFFSLFFQVIFYSAGIYLTLILLGLTQPTLVESMRAVMPISTGVYWFVSAYVAMYLLSPFLNKFISSLSQKSHFTLTVLLVIIFSAWPTLFMFANPYVHSQLSISQGYSLTWFIVLYLIAAYLRLYYRPDFRSLYHLSRYVIVALAVGFCFVSIRHLNSVASIDSLSVLSSFLGGLNSLTTLASSLLLFIAFLNIKIKGDIASGIISTLAPLAFGVYLIHIGPGMNKALWGTIDPSKHADEWWFMAYGAFVVASVYLACSAIDWLRLSAFKRLGRVSVIRSAEDKIASIADITSTGAIKLIHKLLLGQP